MWVISNQHLGIDWKWIVLSATCGLFNLDSSNGFLERKKEKREFLSFYLKIYLFYAIMRELTNAF